jgi:hypothetical protein
MLPHMDTSPVVTVECDRCHRPGWKLTISELSGDVVLDGARIGDDLMPLAFRTGPRPHSYRGQGSRAGAFILDAAGPGQPVGMGEREKLVCAGRKHPRYERVVNRDRWVRAYFSAIAAGRPSIRLSEI